MTVRRRTTWPTSKRPARQHPQPTSRRSAKNKVEIRVVNHGDGLTLFQVAKDDSDFAGRIDALKSTGVRFLICNNTLTERKIDWRGLYGVNEEDIVPSGVAELARLQGMGFTYIHP